MREATLVLHALAIKKHATAEQLAEATGVPLERVRAAIVQAVATGRASEARGKYLLSPAAQMALRGEYAKAYGELRDDRDFVAACDGFERINVELKQVVTHWQTMSVGGRVVPNDHSDPDHDAKILDRLNAVHERVDEVLQRLAQGEPRFGHYQAKLLAALERAEAGEHRWVSDATIESYHTVWFELHEDLLRVVGRRREE